MKYYTMSDVRDELAKRIARAGSVKAFAEQVGVTPGFVAHINMGRRDPSGALLRALGFAKAPLYTKIRNV